MQWVVVVTTGVSCLGELLKVNISLQQLDMRYNDIGEDGILSITDGLHHNNMLKILNVSGCEFLVKGISG